MKIIVASLAAALLAAAASAAAPPVALRFIGLQTIDSAATFDGTRIGGLSSIDYDATTGQFVAVSDDRSQFAAARFYNFTLAYTSTGFTGVTPVRTTVIQRPAGGAFPAFGVDPEALRRSPTGSYVWTNEGDASGANPLQNPTIREMNADGSHVRDFAVPAKYDANTGTTTGIRNNLAFESLAFSPDGATLYAATEAALKQDGPAATLTNGSTARIVRFDAATGAPTAEFAYQVDAVAQAPVPANQFAVSGLTELLALSDTSFLAVERSFSVGAGNTIKIYQFDLGGATDVAGIASLTSGGFTPVAKTLVADLGDLGFAIDNVEGITFGKTLENGRRSIVVVADNNFTPGLATQVLAFEVAGVPEAATWAMMIAGFGLVGGAMRRRVAVAAA